MHKLRVQMLLFLILSMHCLSLYSMELIENEYNKNVLEFVAYNLPCDDYHGHRALSLINKKCNKVVEDRYWPHKKLIEKYVEENKDKLPQLTGKRSWNKDFSKWAWLTYDGDAAAPKVLQLTVIKKFHSQLMQNCALWEDFYVPIFEYNRPFFDKDGQASFYGYGKTQTCGGSYRSFAQYCLDFNGNESRYRCYFYY